MATALNSVEIRYSRFNIYSPWGLMHSKFQSWKVNGRNEGWPKNRWSIENDFFCILSVTTNSNQKTTCPTEQLLGLPRTSQPNEFPPVATLSLILMEGGLVKWGPLYYFVTACERFHTNMSTFSTDALIWVNHKTGPQLSQQLPGIYLHLKVLLQHSASELWSWMIFK